jgi:hypothetical protein
MDKRLFGLVENLPERNVSDSWTRFIFELEPKCQDQKVNFHDLRDWIIDSIKQIEEKHFDYYITSGPIPEDRSQKIDISIVLEKRLYGFTVSQLAEVPLKMIFSIFSISEIRQYSEEVEKEFIRCIFMHSEGLTFYLVDSAFNSAKLREFARKVLNLAWG